jgi:hypothetical protein
VNLALLVTAPDAKEERPAQYVIQTTYSKTTLVNFPLARKDGFSKLKQTNANNVRSKIAKLAPTLTVRAVIAVLLRTSSLATPDVKKTV